MFNDAPRPLLVLLALYFLLATAGALLAGEPYQLVRPVIIGIAAWRTLQGSRAASVFLGGMFALTTVIVGYGALRLAGSDALGASINATFALFTGSISAYVFFSPAMRAIYARGDETRWSR